MKKKMALIGIPVLFVILLLILIATSLRSCSLCYDKSITSHNPPIYCNKISRCSFVGAYEWDGREDTKTISIPNEWDEIPVTQIGGYYGTGVPTPFCIIFPNDYWNGDGIYGEHPDKFDISEPYTIEDIVFTLQIGKNISKVENVSSGYYPLSNADGSITFFHPVVHVVCSEDNKTFYSSNGKLYDRADDQLVTEFDYASGN